MSLRKAANKSATKAASVAKPAAAAKGRAAKPRTKATKATAAAKSPAKVTAAKSREAENELSVAARQLAADLEKRVSAGQEDLMSEAALQALMAALCKTYAVKMQDDHFLPLASTQSVTPTDVMIVTGALLKAADLQVFELGMWQSWTGR